MRILIAPDKFKGSLSAREVAEAIALGLRDAMPTVEPEMVPMADGGEGTAEVICDALNGTWIKCPAHDPLGREIEARYAWIDSRQLAVMEMSEAAGMWRLQPSEAGLASHERDVDRANTFGVGEMLLHAAAQGAREIIIGLGGSATNDGGFGMARALGFKFFENSRELTGQVTELIKLIQIEMPSPLSSPSGRGRRKPPGEGDKSAASSSCMPLPKIVAAVDVRNPLLGENGATRIFGPQKGATEKQLAVLEQALTRLADVAAKQFGRDFRNEPGAGAAGGLGFGLMTFAGATVREGFRVVAEAVDLESKMKDSDVVVTGEGSLDNQTLAGKTAAGVSQMARRLGKPVYAIVGQIKDERARQLFDEVQALVSEAVTQSQSIQEAPALIRERSHSLAETLSL